MSNMMEHSNTGIEDGSGQKSGLDCSRCCNYDNFICAMPHKLPLIGDGNHQMSQPPHLLGEMTWGSYFRRAVRLPQRDPIPVWLCKVP